MQRQLLLIRYVTCLVSVMKEPGDHSPEGRGGERLFVSPPPPFPPLFVCVPWLCVVHSCPPAAPRGEFGAFGRCPCRLRIRRSLSAAPPHQSVGPSVSPQSFAGNVNSEAVVQNKLSHSVRTRFLRFVPLDWNPSGWMGLRVEAYGCSYSEYSRLNTHGDRCMQLRVNVNRRP